MAKMKEENAGSQLARMRWSKATPADRAKQAEIAARARQAKAEKAARHAKDQPQ
jgi:hypothetical protein